MRLAGFSAEALVINAIEGGIMEANQIKTDIEDLKGRAEALRGYL